MPRADAGVFQRAALSRNTQGPRFGGPRCDNDRMDIPEPIRRTIVILLRELIDGPPGETAYMLNQGDRGLLKSLDTLSAEAASARPTGRASVAAHVDHVTYGLHLLNRWAGGEANPWATANWSESWKRLPVTDEEWVKLRANLRGEAQAWMDGAGRERSVSEIEIAGMIGSVAHLAYHLGAIRQLAPVTAGPPERG